MRRDFGDSPPEGVFLPKDLQYMLMSWRVFAGLRMSMLTNLMVC